LVGFSRHIVRYVSGLWRSAIRVLSCEESASWKWAYNECAFL